MAENPRITDLRKRLEREPGSRLFAQLAEELRKDGEYAEAIRVAKEGLQKHPAYPSARMTLGRALFDSGDVQSARVEFEGVLKGAPDNILASRLLAECFDKLGDLSAAIARYKTTLMMAPGDKQVQLHLEDLEARLRGAVTTGERETRRSTSTLPAAAAAAGEAEPAPIPLSAVPDEGFELESSHEAFAPAGPTPGATAPTLAAAPPMADQASAGSPLGVEPEFDFEVPPASTLPFQATPRPLVEELPLSVPRPPAAAAPSAAPALAEEESPELVSSTLAELYFNQGFTDKAIEVYRQLIEREPANTPARARLLELERLDQQGGAQQAPGTKPANSGPVDRRQTIERTITRLENLLTAVRRG